MCVDSTLLPSLAGLPVGQIARTQDAESPGMKSIRVSPWRGAGKDVLKGGGEWERWPLTCQPSGSDEVPGERREGDCPYPRSGGETSQGGQDLKGQTGMGDRHGTPRLPKGQVGAAGDQQLGQFGAGGCWDPQN